MREAVRRSPCSARNRRVDFAVFAHRRCPPAVARAGMPVQRPRRTRARFAVDPGSSARHVRSLQLRAMAVKHRFLLLALLLAAAATYALWPARETLPRPASGTRATPTQATGAAPAAAPALPAGERRTAVDGRSAESPQAPGLRGRTVDDAGRPLAGVQVFAFPLAAHDPFELAALLARGVVEPPAARTTTGDDGAFLLALPLSPTGSPTGGPTGDPAAERLEIRAID